jgi:hypothetical protein
MEVPHALSPVDRDGRGASRPQDLKTSGPSSSTRNFVHLERVETEQKLLGRPTVVVGVP